MPRPVVISRDEIWRRWKLGEAFSKIGRAIGAAKQSVHNVVVARGGVAPARRRRRPGSLRLSEREEIFARIGRRQDTEADRRRAGSCALNHQPRDRTEQE